MSFRRHSSSYGDSDGICSLFKTACTGIIRRMKKGDYDYLAKLGAGCLIGFGCYKLYQRYDPHFFITDHIPHYVTNSMIPTITLSVLLRELSCSANELDGSKKAVQPSHESADPQETRNFSVHSPVEDREINFHDVGKTFGEPSPPALKGIPERDPRLSERQNRTFVDHHHHVPQPPLPVSPRHEDVNFDVNLQPDPGIPGPSGPSIRTGNVYKNIGKLKVHKINEKTTIRGPNASRIKVDSENRYEHIGDAEIIEQNNERIVHET